MTCGGACNLRAEFILAKICDVLLCGGFARKVRTKILKHTLIIYKIKEIKITGRNYFKSLIFKYLYNKVAVAPIKLRVAHKLRLRSAATQNSSQVMLWTILSTGLVVFRVKSYKYKKMYSLKR